jgi:hypothetical protein
MSVASSGYTLMPMDAPMWMSWPWMWIGSASLHRHFSAISDATPT